MEKRVIIAVVLSILVVILWHKFTADMSPLDQQVSQEETAGVVEDVFVEKASESTGRGFAKAEDTKRKETIFETSQFVVTLSNVGGCITRIDLKEYKGREGELFYNLMSVEKSGSGVFAINSQSLGFDEDLFTYRIMKKANMLECSTVFPGYIKVTKRYIFQTNDIIDAEVEFENMDVEHHTFGYDIIGGTNIEAKESFAARYVQVDAKVNDIVYRDRSVKNGILLHPGEVNWVALKNKYFAFLLKPINPSMGSFIRQDKDRILSSGIRMSDISLSPGASITHHFLLYVGPKQEDRLAQIDMGFEEVIYYGIFGGISKFLLSLLRFFYNITNNWGVSIIILAGLMNFVLSPLTRRSFQSMQKMQALQPYIKELQEKYKKTPQKMNKEIMDLYKKHKINPLGGCLPLLLQMPIFIALYQGLIRFIELKNSQFLWINDLSLPDSLPLPFLGGKGIHILPLLMAGTMFLQQKFSHPHHQAGLTEQQQQQQKMMALMMPLLFGFIFYNFPSGLVLYWFTNTLFMTGSQVLMMRKGAEPIRP